MFSFATIVLSALVLGSAPSLAAPVGTRDIHIRTLRGDTGSLPAIAREEPPAPQPTGTVVAANAGRPKILRSLNEDSTIDVRRQHPRDFLRPVPESIPQRRRIVFARDDVEVRHPGHPDTKEPPAKRDAVVPEAPVKRDVVAEPEVKREVVPEPEAKREEPVQPPVKRDVAPMPEVKREEPRSPILPDASLNPRNYTETAAPATKRETLAEAPKHHEKRGPVNFIASFKRELERLD